MYFNFKCIGFITKVISNYNFEKELEIIIKWLKDSGLQAKTELCLFQLNDQPLRSINAMAQQIKVKNQ